ncbi:hypothetical protein N1851_017581 [Merluccius polli]|uniref:Uncharacterized protein n=1 Tax=Merluccius polli TaxID=89951 RepID=A0AA47MQ05_MERPO|nr:hypothetical protein N1851_017581 [Merluccius polli]
MYKATTKKTFKDTTQSPKEYVDGVRLREHWITSHFNILSFPEAFLFERYRFSSATIIYLNHILRPYITNLTHRGRALTSEQTLSIALRCFANGSFLYNIGDAEHIGKVTVGL